MQIRRWFGGYRQRRRRRVARRGPNVVRLLAFAALLVITGVLVLRMLGFLT
jgi:hypothetical protein